LFSTIFAKIFGTKNEREVKRMMPLVQQINALEPAMQQLSGEQLRAKTEEFRSRIRQRLEGIEDEDERARTQKQVLDEILPEAFAVVREAGRRVLNMRHFDVQLIGGMVLHEGKIAEMKTGEGKTLVATLPVYLNSLAGQGVHVVTVNDYLAKRDSEWMGQIYRYLGLTVGVIVHELDDDQRREAYAADVTYGTNNEFGFDYLRDNMKFDLRDCVQRGHHFAIVDEVDSILIDEARTPLIISGSSDESTDKYYKVNRIIPKLEKGEEIEKSIEEKVLTGDYAVDEKHHTITVTDEGWEKVEKLLGITNIADPENWDLKHHVETAIKAHALYKRDVNYVVKEGEVLIVDEFTGRLMPGRRWSDGLHQAVEAKEGVKIERENQTLATVTFQNYFRMYKKLAGMTGTAETEGAEFYKVYKLEVTVIPTNRPLLRHEHPDVVYRTEREKFNALAEEIEKIHEGGRPVLVGTVSIEKSERLSDLLKQRRVPHVVLNAKFHEKEAEIVVQAGRSGAVTIATNMAGRGTDILLGGNFEFMAKQECLKKGLAQPVQEAAGRIGEHASEDQDKVTFYYQGSEYQAPADRWEELLNKHRQQMEGEHADVVGLGGLHILGTERHEARRIDNQLRGRAGRQGDPGSSRFYLSLEDDLMRIFGRDWVGPMLQRLGMEEGVPIESRMLSRRIVKVQEAVEGRNFEARKHLLEYDDVMNKQREAVYGLRRQLLEGAEQKEIILDDYVGDILAGLLDEYVPLKSHPDQWNLEGLKNRIFTGFGVDIVAEGVDARNLNRTELGDAIFEKLKQRYEAKEKLLGPEAMRHHERIIMLSVMDTQWKDHLLSMDHLREGIGLRGYGQHDPLVEYKRESFDMFEAMMQRFQEETVRYLYLMQVIEREAPASAEEVAAAEAETRRRRAATSVDDLEEEFQRKKKRELEEARMAGSGDYQPVQQVIRSGAKVGRNDPCPCGSGKKYKKCCGMAA
jgi:preprotein translocase subunit SecA